MTSDRLPEPLATIRAVDAKVQKVEVAVCLGALGVMVLLAFVQVFLRQLQGSALGGVLPEPVPWFDNIARHLVIWVGVLGASLAAAEGRHISIEALPKFLSPRGRRCVDVLVGLSSIAITAILVALCAIYLYRLHLVPWMAGHDEPLFVIQALDLHVPRWLFLGIVPIGLALMGVRFGVRGLEAVLLDDEAYARLREEDEQRDIQALEATQEEHEVALLLDHDRRSAAESGAHPKLDPDSARAEVREVMKSGPVKKVQPPKKAAGQDLLGSDSGDDEEDTPPPKRRSTPPYRPPSMRSTAEIEAYHPQALHDDLDKADPVMRKGAALLDSAEALEASGDDLPTDIALSSDDAEEAVEALADSERRRPPHGLDSSEEVAAYVPDPDGTAVTERVPVELPAKVQVVVVVRGRGGDA